MPPAIAATDLRIRRPTTSFLRTPSPIDVFVLNPAGPPTLSFLGTSDYPAERMFDPDLRKDIWQFSFDGVDLAAVVASPHADWLHVFAFFFDGDPSDRAFVNAEIARVMRRFPAR